MARLPRYFSKGLPQHVILRGNNGDAIFASGEGCAFFKDVQLQAASRYALAIHACVLRSNHIHLLLGAGRRAISGKDRASDEAQNDVVAQGKTKEG